MIIVVISLSTSRVIIILITPYQKKSTVLNYWYLSTFVYGTYVIDRFKKQKILLMILYLAQSLS